MDQASPMTEQDPVLRTVCEVWALGETVGDQIAWIHAVWAEVLYPVMERAVGGRLSTDLSATEMEEFEALVEGGEPTAAEKWLDEHVPHHRQVVAEELALLTAAAAAAFIRKLERPHKGATS